MYVYLRAFSNYLDFYKNGCIAYSVIFFQITISKCITNEYEVIYCQDIGTIRISLIQMVRELCRGKKAEMVTMVTQEFMVF